MRTSSSTLRVARTVLLGIGLAFTTLLAGRVQPVEAKHVEHHASLHPTGVWYQYRHSLYTGPILSSCVPPANPDPTDSGLPVGYSYHSYSDNGCGQSDVYQTRVVFDLSEFQRFGLVNGDPVYARLTYQEYFVDTTDPPPPGSQGVTCVDRLRIATSEMTQDGQFSVQDGDLFRAGLLNSDPWSVNDVARGWIDGSVPNFGLVLQGYDESLDFRNDACLSALSNLTLDVAAIWNVPQPDLRVQSISVTDKNGSHVCATGSINVATTIHNESDVGAATYDVLLEVDGQPRETVIAGPIGSYTDRPEIFLTTVNLGAGNHTLQVLVDPDHHLSRIEDPTDVGSVSVNCAQGAAPTPVPKMANLQIATVEVQDPDGHPRCVAGNANNVHQVIKNTGDFDVNDVITVQLSIDGKPARSVTVGGLAANSQKDSYITNVPLNAGNHTLKVTADPDHNISGATTTNNSATRQVTCARS